MSRCLVAAVTGYAVLLATVAAVVSAEPAAIRIAVPAQASPCVRYGADRLAGVLGARAWEVRIVNDVPSGPEPRTIVVGVAGDRPLSADAGMGVAGKKESYALVCRPGASVLVSGADAAGAMYGCLDLAARISATGQVPEHLELLEIPAMSLRGTCILLMKLGLYDYPVTPQEFPFFYDKELWLSYLDFLADNRFNYIALWNGHPFDYFVKLDKYPEAQDGMSPGLLARNHEMLAWLATEAQRRNIWLMFQFYQIHTSTYFAKAHDLPPHGNPAPTPLLTDYTSHCIERFVSEFPGVGLYICPGETLELRYVAGWVNDVIFAAVKRTGRNPPIMIRSWGIDLPNMKKVAGHYSPLYTERKFNVEHIASTEVDPENLAWSRITGEHVVNIHCLGNLEPFRWSPPSYIQRCIQSSIRDGGATGLHLYPRKCWRWPYGCDKVAAPELQWDRDRLWFETWARYAWNPNREPQSERRHWISRLAGTYGAAEAGEHLLNAYEAQADVLPGIQRLFWLGNDNHTTAVSGITIEQVEESKGIPFLKVPGMVRIPEYLNGLIKDEPLNGVNPDGFLAAKIAEAEQALEQARLGAVAATVHQADAARVEGDARAVLAIARFYCMKVQAAAAHTLAMNGIDPPANLRKCLAELEASVVEYRKLAELTSKTYESLSDVPMWKPVPRLKACPYHWTDLLPYFEEELEIVRHNTRVLADHPELLSGRTATRPAPDAKAQFLKQRIRID